jgi:hypothetical protein
MARQFFLAMVAADKIPQRHDTDPEFTLIPQSLYLSRKTWATQSSNFTRFTLFEIHLDLISIAWISSAPATAGSVNSAGAASLKG